jgi:hypothetical protein
MGKDVYAHFPPKKGEKREGQRIIKQREVYIPSGWYTYKEILDFAIKADRTYDD